MCSLQYATPADIDADIEACASAEDYSDEEMAKYIEERTDTEEGLEKAETMVSELGLDS